MRGEIEESRVYKCVCAVYILFSATVLDTRRNIHFSFLLIFITLLLVFLSISIYLCHE